VSHLHSSGNAVPNAGAVDETAAPVYALRGRRHA
jgi:hypothetical protein